MISMDAAAEITRSRIQRPRPLIRGDAGGTGSAMGTVWPLESGSAGLGKDESSEAISIPDYYLFIICTQALRAGTSSARETAFEWV